MFEIIIMDKLNNSFKRPIGWKKFKSESMSNLGDIKLQFIGLCIFYYFIFGILPKFFFKLPFELFAVISSNVDMIGDIFGTALPEFFNYTYSNDPPNILSYLSTIFINLLAISGVLFQGAISISKDGINRGLTIMIIMFFITYLLPTLIIPYIQKHVIKYVFMKDGKLIKTKWFDKRRFIEILIGILIACLFIYIEYYLLKHFIKLASNNNKRSYLEVTIHNIFFKGLKSKIDI